MILASRCKQNQQKLLVITLASMVKAQDFITIIGEPSTFGQAAARVGLFEEAGQERGRSAVMVSRCVAFFIGLEEGL